MVSCHNLPVDLSHQEASMFRLQDSREFRRSYGLFSLCSGGSVQISGRGVDAQAAPDSPHANISFVSARTRHHPNSLNILGTHSGGYLCFNKRGRLLVRLNGRKKQCLFMEGFSRDHYTVLQSLYNPTWYVGFNSKGKPMKGSLHNRTKLQKCFNFIKRSPHHHRTAHDDNRHGPRFDPRKIGEDLLHKRPRRRGR